MSAARRFGTNRKLPRGRFQARYSHYGKQVGAKNTFPRQAIINASIGFSSSMP